MKKIKLSEEELDRREARWLLHEAMWYNNRTYDYAKAYALMHRLLKLVVKE
jgi:hypothetical protein